MFPPRIFASRCNAIGPSFTDCFPFESGVTGTTPSRRRESEYGQSRVAGGKIAVETVFWSLFRGFSGRQRVTWRKAELTVRWRQCCLLLFPDSWLPTGTSGL